MAKRGTSVLPYVAVNLDGDLQVTVFENEKDAREMYEALKSEYASSSSFEENEDKTEFTVDDEVGPCVKVGKANYVGNNTKWRIK